MQPQNQQDYNAVFTELIKKQILILGPDITLAKVKNVQGLEVDGSGNVTNVTGDPQVVLQNLINQFMELSGLIIKKTMESILSTKVGSPAPAAQVASQSPQQNAQVPLANTENSTDLDKMVADITASAQQLQQGTTTIDK